MLSAALPLCVLLALSSAVEAHKPCPPPDQIQGLVTVMYPSLWMDYGTFAYDAVKERMYTLLTIVRGDQHWLQGDLQLFQEGFAYQFFPGNKTCVKSPLSTPFPSLTLPKNATFISSIWLGTTSIPDAGLMADVWTAEQDGVYHSITFTQPGCVPQWRASFGSDGWVGRSFYNLTLSIFDPSVFTPPPQCQ